MSLLKERNVLLVSQMKYEYLNYGYFGILIIQHEKINLLGKFLRVKAKT
jgi:hypothetical protein